MAKKKKEQQRSYMQSFVPEGGGKRYSYERAYFYGLDRRERTDSGYMYECKNIDVSRLPEVMSAVTAVQMEQHIAGYGDIVGFYGYDDMLFAVCENGKEITVLKIKSDSITASKPWEFDKENVSSGANREMTVFCYYKNDDSKIYYEMSPTYYLLIYPDRRYIPVDFEGGTETEIIACEKQESTEVNKGEDNSGDTEAGSGTSEIMQTSTTETGDTESSTEKSLSPVFEHITVWNSRLFGTRANVVVCSSAGTPFDWTCDTPQIYDESHAWYSTTQANIKASGDIVAIVAYDGHPIIFKDDYMHQINNNKNPFRIQDIVAVGCVGARSICELDGVLYFASHDGIYRYGGGYPERISDALNYYSFSENTVCGAYDGVLYVYNPDLDDGLIYTFCPENGMWACIDNPHKSNIFAFAMNDKGLYSIGEDCYIYAYPLRGNNGSNEVDWSFTTDISILESAGDKRLHSLKVFAEGDDLEVSLICNRKGGTPVKIISENNISGKNSVRVMLRKFDNIWHKLRFSGEGNIRIRYIEVVYSLSGERYV